MLTYISVILFEGGLLPSRRRSIFTLASFMLLFSARAGDLPELIPIIKASLDNIMVKSLNLSIGLVHSIVLDSHADMC